MSQEPASALPRGQHLARGFFRFGLPTFAWRFPRNPERIAVKIHGDVAQSLDLRDELQTLPRVEQTSDFHCVTSWSCRQLHWSGYRFADFYQHIVVPRVQPQAEARLVVLRGEDGYAATLPLDDLLKQDVLLADQLDGAPLGIAHGAPLRLVAPAHYGYKNVKHLQTIEFWRDARHFRFARPWPSLMHHPRARVALEERGVGVPPTLLRWIYLPIVPITRCLFRIAQARHERRR